MGARRCPGVVDADRDLALIVTGRNVPEDPFELKLAIDLKSRMNTGSPAFLAMLFSGGMVWSVDSGWTFKSLFGVDP